MIKLRMLTGLVCIAAICSLSRLNAMQQPRDNEKIIKHIKMLEREALNQAIINGQAPTAAQETDLKTGIAGIVTNLKLAKTFRTANARLLLGIYANKWLKWGYDWVNPLVTGIEKSIAQLETAHKEAREQSDDEFEDAIGSPDSPTTAANTASTSQPTLPLVTPTHVPPSFMQKITTSCQTNRWVAVGLIVSGIVATYLAWSTWRAKKDKKPIEPTHIGKCEFGTYTSQQIL